MGIVKPMFEVVLDTRRQKADGTYPLKLRVTFNRVRKYYSIGIDIGVEQYERLNSPGRKDDALKDIKVKMRSIVVNAEETAKKIESFTFKEFENQYFAVAEEPKTTNVYTLLKQYSEQLKQEGRISSSESYQDSLKSLQSYKSKLFFNELNVSFLKGYEKYMESKGRSSTTVGIYLRNLRTIFNQAIDTGLVPKDSYPFRKGKFSIPAGRNIKKALTIGDIQKVFEYPTTEKTSEDKAKDFWIFSYLCNGLNIKDICQMKYRDIDGDTLTVIRAKTRLTTKSDQLPVAIHLSDRAKAIIEKWGTRPVLPNAYVFDILSENIDPSRERDLIKYFTKLINKYMKVIGNNLGIEKPVTTYTARHSFSTVLKRSGVSTEFISESLGHKNLGTTKAYLDSFEDDVKKEYANYLTNFDGK